jgi:hypothetical protein
MTTEPGILPRDVARLRYDLLPKGLCNVIDQVGSRMKKLETYILADSKNK